MKFIRLRERQKINKLKNAKLSNVKFLLFSDMVSHELVFLKYVECKNKQMTTKLTFLKM